MKFCKKLSIVILLSAVVFATDSYAMAENYWESITSSLEKLAYQKELSDQVEVRRMHLKKHQNLFEADPTHKNIYACHGKLLCAHIWRAKRFAELLKNHSLKDADTILTNESTLRVYHNDPEYKRYASIIQK